MYSRGTVQQSHDDNIVYFWLMLGELQLIDNHTPKTMYRNMFVFKYIYIYKIYLF